MFLKDMGMKKQNYSPSSRRSKNSKVNKSFPVTNVEVTEITNREAIEVTEETTTKSKEVETKKGADMISHMVGLKRAQRTSSSKPQIWE